MTKIDLHIVSFDVPYPADYGGVIDVYYKAIALEKLGCRIALHCFDYGRGPQEKLAEQVSEVHYYERNTGLLNHFSLLPFIVKSRMNEELRLNLIKDDANILFEGLHCCGFLNHPSLLNRNKFVRAHNIEHQYYSDLAKSEKSFLHKIYHWIEAKKLKKFEPILSKTSNIFALSLSDQEYFKRYTLKAKYLPIFYEENVSPKPPSVKDYVLYHGNLGVSENESAVMLLLEEIKNIDYPIVIAGKSPSKKLEEYCKGLKQVELIANPSHALLNRLVAEAKLCCLPSMQSTGIKLKLINSLMLGNAVLVNKSMVDGNALAQHCDVIENNSKWNATVCSIMESPLDDEKIRRRKLALKEQFSNKENAKHLLEWLGEVQ